MKTSCLTLFILCAVLLTLAAPASAQLNPTNCSINMYADVNGQLSGLVIPTELVPFDVVVILRVDNVVNAVAYNLVVEPAGELGTNLFILNQAYGPNGTGINIITPGGNNIGLGGCAVGFNNQDILVTRYTMLATANFPGGSTIYASNNPDVDGLTTFPQYATCNGQVIACGFGDKVLVNPPISTTNESWGAVKSLY